MARLMLDAGKGLLKNALDVGKSIFTNEKNVGKTAETAAGFFKGLGQFKKPLLLGGTAAGITCLLYTSDAADD